MCFPTFPRFCGQTFLEAKDKELAEACVVAYNDFMVEEWCGDSGGRLHPALSDPAVGRRDGGGRGTTQRGTGCAGGVLQRDPTPSRPAEHPQRVLGPLLRRLRGDPNGRVHAYRIVVKMPATSADAPVAVAATLSFDNAMASLTDFLFSGVLVRFPRLMLAYSEGQIGWLPYILERADDVWREHRAWGGVKDLVPEPPSTYFQRQVYGCFFRDQHGLDSLDVIGVDRITFETDYPHTDSTWPDTRAVAERMVRDLSDDDVYRIMRGNAIEMLGLDIS